MQKRNLKGDIIAVVEHLRCSGVIVCCPRTRSNGFNLKEIHSGRMLGESSGLHELCQSVEDCHMKRQALIQPMSSEDDCSSAKDALVGQMLSKKLDVMRPRCLTSS